MESLFERIRALIAQDEVELAAEQLDAFLKGAATTEIFREVLVQKGRLARLRKQARRGFLSGNELSSERSKIADALLQLLDELASRTTTAERPFPVTNVSLVPPTNTDLEKIIGTNNLKSIAWLHQALEVAKSVCRVVTPKGLGTGFLIDQRTVMTNHHVLSHAEVAARSFAEFNFQEDVTGKLQQFFRYRLLGDEFQTNPELDFSAVRIDPGVSLPPLESWGILEVAGGPPPAVGEHVSIIQHPGGGAKQIALTANQVVNIFEHRLQYTTDTLPGSSGSPVFNDDWQVVALHCAGGNLVTNQQGDRMFANEGTIMAAILERLRINLQI